MTHAYVLRLLADVQFYLHIESRFDGYKCTDRETPFIPLYYKYDAGLPWPLAAAATR